GDLAEGLHRGGDHRRALVGIGHIGLDAEGAAPKSLDEGLRLVETIEPSRAEHHVGTCFGKPLGDGDAEPGRGARHQRDRTVEAARVLGVLVEIQARRRIFVPIGRVTSIEADAVLLSTGTVSLRRFDKRPGETLVLAELLDRRVTLLGADYGNADASIVDVAME